MNIIEPCCAERQACFLLREERGHAVLMQTNGDVTIAKWLQAVMLLSGDRPRTLTLWLPPTAVPSVAVSQQPSKSPAAVPAASPSGPTLTAASPSHAAVPSVAVSQQPSKSPAAILTTVSKYLRLGWVKKLRLMTPSPLTYNDIKHLAEQTEGTVEDLLPHLELAADSTITNGLLQFDGTDGTVIIQGIIPATVTPALHLYAGIFGRTDGKAIRTITDTTNAHFRARRYNPSPFSASSGSAAFSASSGSAAAPSPAPSSPSAPGSVPSGTAAGEVTPSSRKHKKKENGHHTVITRFLSPTHI